MSFVNIGNFKKRHRPQLKRVTERKKVHTRQPNALVLVPTREIAVQVAADFRKLTAGTDLRVAAIHGSQDSLYQIEKMRNGVNILISTVGKSEHFLTSELLDFKKLDFIAIDESDQILLPSKRTGCDYLKKKVRKLRA